MVAVASSGGSFGVATKKGRLLRRFKRLESDRFSWRSHWMEISDNLLTRRGRFLIDSQSNRGRKRSNKIVDSTGGQALRTMAAGMMSGMTSPARPWFRLQTPDPNLMEKHDVRLWLTAVEKVIRGILNDSNFYNTIHTSYTELGAFGTHAVYRQKSSKTVINYKAFTAGEYVIAENDEGEVDTLGRQMTMTISQMVEKFVAGALSPGEADWSKVSIQVKNLWDKGSYDELVPVVHMIQPRRPGERDLDRDDNMNKKYVDAYMEYANDADTLLAESGTNKFPAYCPRWDVLGGDIYGRGPGMEHLGDIKQLQAEQKRKAQAIDKMVNPPMTAPSSLKGKPTTVLPGGTTYIDQMQGQQGFQPAYLVNPRIAELTADITEVQQRIVRGFYADLFAMMISSDRRQITATEVVERHEEKLVLLGPVLQRLNTELLNPVIEDAFDFAAAAGMLPPAPTALQGVDLKIKYISLLAQAQEAAAAGTIERVLSFAGNLSGAFPQILDVVDEDNALRDYSDAIGGSPDLLRSKELVEQRRKQRAEAAAQEQQQMAAAQGADTAKVLSETDTQNPNALTKLLQGVGP